MTSPPPSIPPAPQPDERTLEQQAAVRRRALPVAFAGTICGAAGILLPLITPIDAYTPPSLLATNLAFSALLIGAGIFFYAKGTPGTRPASILSALAVLLGMIGTLLYTWQAVHSRDLREKLEIQHVEAIAAGAKTYAAGHGGAYPADLLILLEEKAITPQTLQSPFGKRSDFLTQMGAGGGPATQPAREELLKSVETASDYLYLGSDLKNVPDDAAKDIIVAASTNTVLRVSLALAFADGKARYITLDEVPAVMTACNDARKKMGLGELRPPEILKQALEELQKTSKPGQ